MERSSRPCSTRQRAWHVILKEVSHVDFHLSQAGDRLQTVAPYVALNPLEPRPEASSVQPETVDGEALKQGNMKAIEVRILAILEEFRRFSMIFEAFRYV